MPEKKFLHLNEHGNSGKEVAATPKVWTKANQATPKKKRAVELRRGCMYNSKSQSLLGWLPEREDDADDNRGCGALSFVSSPASSQFSRCVCVCGFAGFQCSTPLKAVPRKFSPRSLLHRNNRKKIKTLAITEMSKYVLLL